MAGMLYGLWNADNETWYWEGGAAEGVLFRTTHRGLAEAQLQGGLLVPGYFTVEIIGEDGLPEQKRRSAIPSWVSHAPPEEESGD